MIIDFKNCTEVELWHYVAVHLKKHNIDTVLVGGSVVSIYTNGAYKSGDLDFIKLDLFTTGLDKAMKEIGFINKGSRHYVHPECKHLYVEFPGSPPLGIGEDNLIYPDETEVEGQVIKILSPTDCVKDRLASYIHYKALECLDQAVMVAKVHPVKLDEIKKWCMGEKGLKQWDDFINKLRDE
jgi:hypothetical protein